MAGQRKQKTINLPRGIFVLRYESAGDSMAPPSVLVICEASKNTAILHPDSTDAVLTRPGSGLVLQAKSEGSVILEIFSEFPNGSLEATLKCEALSGLMRFMISIICCGFQKRIKLIHTPKFSSK